jgi:alkanesulfonate monooxygenase SsuD/methylene tetrahydromethanopterin reductase-like flavin-dependent oxidoreductase (luciferase family)
VGGSSTAAIRRAARYGDAWHPLNARLDWLAQSGLPRLRQMAEQEHRATPAFAPRIRVRLTESPVQDPNRQPGHGTLDQLRADLDRLQAMGAEWIVFDTYSGNVADLAAAPEAGRQALEILLEKAFDVRGQRLRTS